MLCKAESPFFERRRREAQSLRKASQESRRKGDGLPAAALLSTPRAHVRDHLQRLVGRPPPQWLRVHKLTFHTSQEQAGLTSERSRVSAARGPTGTPISTSSAPLPAPGAWTRRAPFQLHVNDPTHLLCRHRRAPEAKRTRRLLIWARQLRLPRDPRFGSREGIKKKKKGGGKDRKYAGNSHVCQRVLQSSERRSRETAASFYVLMFYTQQELPEEEC